MSGPWKKQAVVNGPYSWLVRFSVTQSEAARPIPSRQPRTRSSHRLSGSCRSISSTRRRATDIMAIPRRLIGLYRARARISRVSVCDAS